MRGLPALLLLAAASSLAPAAWAQDEPRYDAHGRPIDEPEPPPPPEDITFPEPIERVSPNYTDEAKAAGVEGVVLLDVTISETGEVVAAKVARGLGHGLDEEALAAIRKMRFSPARRGDGTPFRATIQYQFEFTLAEREVEEPSAAMGELRGTVLAASDELPLPGAALTLQSISDESAPYDEPIERAVVSDEQGAFDFGALPPGEYRLSITAPGFEELLVRETINERTETQATYRLVRQPEAGVVEIIVTGERPPREVTRRTIERREIERIPGTNGDALRSLQNLPGVARPPSIFGALLVRGSSPLDTQTFIDGTYVPIIYHFGGLSSVVPTELLSKIDFYPGNFSARYGRALGGIVDAGLRSPRSDGYHGLAQIDLIDVRGLFEGPIPGTGGDWSFAAGFRRSYVDAWLEPVLEEAGAGVTQAPVYYDWQLIVEGKPKPRHRFRTSFYGSDDRLELLLSNPSPNEPAVSGDVGIVTAFQRLAFHYEHDTPEGHRVRAQLALGREDVQFGLSQFFLRIKALSTFGRAEYSHRFSDMATLHAGVDVYGSWYDVALRLPAPPLPGQPPNQPFSTREQQSHAEQSIAFMPASYVELEVTPHRRVRLIPGARLDYTNFNDRFDLSPRFNGRFLAHESFPRTTIKGGIGVFHQAPQIQEARPPLGNPELRSNRAIHYGLGVEQEITRQIEASLEGFYRQVDDVVVGKPAPSGAASVVYTNDATGYSGGAELLLKYKPDDRFFGWLAYTLSRSARQNGPDEPEYTVSWDQTHILTLLGSYRLGGGWEMGARFRLVSGNLVTPHVCDFTDPSCNQGRINALFHGASGAYTPIPAGTLNSERMPLFHQLDLRVDKTWQFAKWKLSAYLDVQNVYNHQNAEGILYNYNYTRRQYVTGLPILPSLGIRGEL